MMGNDETLVNKFLNIFKNQCPQQLQELLLHYKNEDWSSLSTAAHSMKTQFQYLSIQSLSAQISEIETLTDEGKTDKLSDLIPSFEKDLTEFLKKLN
jgi:HPt (histidine-containing phosphotransfer) domain-containing protein